MRPVVRIRQCLFAITWFMAGLIGCGRPESARQPQPELSQVQSTQSGCDMSIVTANRFHLALIARIGKVFIRDTQLGIQYNGLLLDDGRGRGQRIHGSIGTPYTWTIIGSDEQHVFDITASLEETPRYDVMAPVGSEKVYVRVSRILFSDHPSPSEMETKRDNLGGESIQDLLLNMRNPVEEELNE